MSENRGSGLLSSRRRNCSSTPDQLRVKDRMLDHSVKVCYWKQRAFAENQ